LLLNSSSSSEKSATRSGNSRTGFVMLPRPLSDCFDMKGMDHPVAFSYTSLTDYVRYAVHTANVAAKCLALLVRSREIQCSNISPVKWPIWLRYIVIFIGICRHVGHDRNL
jgi:hypothetical protein